MSTRSEMLSDRVFILASHGTDLARLISRGSSEMFWESFLVEPLAKDAIPAKLLDADIWSEVDFVLRHERTGIIIENVFSAGGHPPSRLEPNKSLHVRIRGTYTFTPPARPASFLKWIIARLRIIRDK